MKIVGCGGNGAMHIEMNLESGTMNLSLKERNQRIKNLNKSFNTEQTNHRCSDLNALFKEIEMKNWIIFICVCITVIDIIKKRWDDRKKKMVLSSLTEKEFKAREVRYFWQRFCKITTCGYHWFKQIEPDSNERIFKCCICDALNKDGIVLKTVIIKTIKKYPITFLTIISCLICIVFKFFMWR